MTTDVNFAADACNSFSVPESKPFYIVEFGYGYAYRVYMTQTGEMLGIMGPQTMLISWGTGLLDGAAAATPGSHDVTRGEAIRNTQNALLDMANLPADEVYAMDARARFAYHDLYCHGQEPVWGVSWSKEGEVLWNVLWGYDGSYMDAEPAGKVFDQVLRPDVSLADLGRERCGELGMTEWFCNANGDYYYDWFLEEKAAFSKMWVPLVKEYEAERPYCHE